MVSQSEGGGSECDEGLHGNETPGFNLETDCLRARSPGAGPDGAARRAKTLRVCVRYLRVSAGARAYTVYMTGRDPGGGGAM